MMNLRNIALALAVAGCGCWLQSDLPAQEPIKELMPLSNSPSASDLMNQTRALSYRQQQARFVAEQTMLRMEWNKWHGYVPARPNTNSSYLSSGLYNFQPAYQYQTVYSSHNRFYGW